jgi:Na+/melibiose symporter-like transporter
MMEEKKMGKAKNNQKQSSNDGVTYRRAKTWQIALSQLNSGAAMCFYILIGYASYVGNVGYGVATALVGMIITGTRIFDGITDPIIALLIDKTNTRFGKLRIFMLGGWLIETLAVIMMFNWFSGKGHGVILFILVYMLYVIGYTMNNVAGQIISPVLTNDPKQRPLVGVWATIYNYFVPMGISMGITVGILPKYGNEYTVPMLAAACIFTVTVSFVLEVLACIGITPADKPESFVGIKTQSKQGKVKLKDMLAILKSNRALQTYIFAATSDKLAVQTAGQAIVTTMLYGIIIGNMQLSTIVSLVAMLPSILFAIYGARYAGKHGNKESILVWTRACMIGTVVMVLFFLLTSSWKAAEVLPLMVIFFILTLVINGCKMCVTTATNAMLADVIDYELARSGKYMPGIITGVYGFIDKLVSSLGATVAAGCVALIGYTATMPQPTDQKTTSIFWMTMALSYGLPILGWLCTLVALRYSPLSKEKMVEVQKNIQDKKVQALEAEKTA